MVNLSCLKNGAELPLLNPVLQRGTGGESLHQLYLVRLFFLRA